MNYAGSFTQYLADLVNLYKKREGMSGDQARRLVMDMADDVLDAFQSGTSPQEFYSEGA